MRNGVLIETQWNVKFHSVIFGWFIGFVLIETQWNVKKDVVDAMQKTRQCINRNIVECKEIPEKPFSTGMPGVLIETQWNVKQIWTTEAKPAEQRINRNIVECKVHYTPPTSSVGASY